MCTSLKCYWKLSLCVSVLKFMRLFVVKSSRIYSPCSLKAKQVELQFTVGEAISSASVGASSGAARDPWTCTEEQYSPPKSMESQYFRHSHSAVAVNRDACQMLKILKWDCYIFFEIHPFFFLTLIMFRCERQWCGSLGPQLHTV